MCILLFWSKDYGKDHDNKFDVNISGVGLMIMMTMIWIHVQTNTVFTTLVVSVARTEEDFVTATINLHTFRIKIHDRHRSTFKVLMASLFFQCTYTMANPFNCFKLTLLCLQTYYREEILINRCRKRGESERERDRERETERDSQRETEIDREKQRDRQT